MKITPEGEQKGVFSLERVPGFHKVSAEVKDFAVGLRGEVFLVVRRCERGKPPKCEVDIISFEDDGTHRSTTKLEYYFSPFQLAVFLSGDFLVAGLTLDQPREPEEASKGSSDSKPFTAIFDRAGRVRAQLREFEESNVQATTESEKELDDTRLDVQLGMAAAGEDGNVYLAHRTPNPVVHVISPDGKMVRQLRVMGPTKNAWPLRMQYTAGGRLLFEFGEKLDESSYDLARAVYSLVDAETGERVTDYQSAPDVGGAFLCHTPSGFTFLRVTREGRSVIRQVVPQ